MIDSQVFKEPRMVMGPWEPTPCLPARAAGGVGMEAEGRAVGGAVPG